MGIINLKEVFWLSKKYWYAFMVFPVVIAASVFFFTRNSPKIYDSSTVIYTGISTRKSADLTESLKIDFFTSNNLMDNIITLINSRQSMEETSLNLLSIYMSMEGPDERLLSSKKYEELKSHISDELWKKISVLKNPEKTLENIYKDLAENSDSTFKYLLNYSFDYGYSSIMRRIRVDRRKNSDMIEISFFSDDPGLSYLTVKILGEVYLKRYSDLRRSESVSSVEYFERTLKKTYERLQISEDKLKAFITENRIMNYYEQAKSLDIYRKEVEVLQNQSQAAANGANLALEKLEEKLKKSNLRSEVLDSLSILRKESAELRVLATTSIKNVKSEFNNESEIRTRINQISNELNNKISRLYNFDYKVDGVPTSNILLEWLSLYIEKEKETIIYENAYKSLILVDDRIDVFAPLGAELKKLEREVGIIESEYLSVLHGLNQARLQTENLKVSQTQETIDPPLYPETPRSSKRKILVIGGGALGFFLVLGAIVVYLLLDSSLKNIKNATEKTGLSVIGISPIKKTGIESLQKQTFELISSKVQIKFNESKDYRPFVISIIAQELKESEYQNIDQLNKLCEEMKYRSLLIHPNLEGLHGKSYEIHDYKSQDILDSQLFLENKDYDIIFFIHPTSKENTLSFKTLNKSHWVILIARSKYVWKLWHQRIVEIIEASSKKKPDLLLIDVSLEETKDFLKI